MKHKLKKSVLITDLDNTIFNWVEIWFHSFNAMLKKIEEISGVDESILKQEIRKIHRKHGTSEYAFLIEELSILKNGMDADQINRKYRPAVHEYRINRDRYLSTYPNTMETLEEISLRGAKIVGYTESMAFYTNYRMRKLNLDSIIDVLYSPKDHDIPEGLSLSQIRKYPCKHYQFRKTKHKHTPEGELKPNPGVLVDIIRDLGVEPDDCVYVGDSIFKDVAMAQDANILDVYAKYGSAQGWSEYELLREVTHWSDEQVEEEKRIGQREICPTFILENGFYEILEIIDFVSYGTRDA